MELRHIKIDYNEALNAKRNVLSAEIDSLEVIKKIKSYKLLRKEENNIKNRLKKEISSIKSTLSLLESNLPKEIKEMQDEEQNKLRNKEKDKRIQAKDNSKSELEDIKRKLEMLSK